jgi:DNA repair exonuclease SbcCD nuclease subunit
MKKTNKKSRIRRHLVVIIILMIILTILFFSLILSIFTQKPLLLINQSSESFTVIVLPDTQYYSEYNPNIFANQTRWIVNNIDSMNIQMIIHEGDIVNNNNQKQWDNANYSLSILDQANIPYSILPGNHDSDIRTDYKFYDEYFPKERFENKSWYNEGFANYRNNYQLLNINNKSYLFLSLELCPNKSEINWANQVLTNNQYNLAILTTHGYLSASEPPKRYVYNCGSTQYLWDDLIKLHKNLRIVLSGHIHNEKRRVDDNIFDQSVYQIVSDYQDEKQGGGGYLRILKFDTDNNLINIETYSPYLNRYKTGYDSQFSIKL